MNSACPDRSKLNHVVVIPVLVPWVALSLEAGDLDTATISLSSSMLGYYCAWVLRFLAAGFFERLGVQIALFGAQVLLWIGSGGLYYLRNRREEKKRHPGVRGLIDGGGGGIPERLDGEPGIEI